MSETAPDHLGAPNRLAVLAPGVILVCRHGQTLITGWAFDASRMSQPAPIDRVVDWLAVAFPSTVRQDAHMPHECTFCAAADLDP